MLYFLQSDTTGLKDFIVPDSLQKAQLADFVNKWVHMDYGEFATDVLKEGAWVLLKIAIALGIYFVGRLLIKWLVRIMDRAFERRNVEISLRSFLRSLVKILLIIVLMLAMVQTLGINTSSFLAIFASAGLAIGMALSGTLQNFAGGVVLLILRPYKVGDYIEAQEQCGTVDEIGLFQTRLRTTDNRIIYVPNSSISTSVIDNYSQSEKRRVEWILSISYGDDVDVAREAIMAMLREDRRVLVEIEPAVYVKTLNSSSVDLVIRAWVSTDDYWMLYFDINERMYKELPSKGINFPFPQLDVNLKNNK